MSKAAAVVEAYGTIDELNSAVAIATAEVQGSRFKVEGKQIEDSLQEIHSDLFHIGAILAGETKEKKKRLNLLERRASELESEIDRIQRQLLQQRVFYFPGGSKLSAQLDFARSVCRRAERRIVALADRDRGTEVVKYLNRLSDCLYALARWVNDKVGVEERKWKSGL